MDLRNNIQAVLLPLNLYTQRYSRRNIHSQVKDIVAKVIFLFGFFFFFETSSLPCLALTTLESHRPGWPQTQRSACSWAQSNLPLSIITWSLKNTYAYKMFSLPFLQCRVQSHPPQQPLVFDCLYCHLGTNIFFVLSILSSWLGFHGILFFCSTRYRTQIPVDGSQEL